MKNHVRRGRGLYRVYGVEANGSAASAPARPLLEVFVPGEPVARPSSRQWTRRKRLAAWYEAIAWTVKAQRVGLPLVDEPIELWLTFRTNKRADGSNLHKAVEDAMNRVFYTDDRAVAEGHFRILRCGDTRQGWQPGVEILAYRLGEGPGWPQGKRTPPADPSDRGRAGSRLLAAVSALGEAKQAPSSGEHDHDQPKADHD